ncbi:MAG: DJ-1/PfpI family protein [Chthoniobacterales bacterium]
MRCEILLYPGAEELDVLGPYEVLQAARSLGADIETALISFGGIEPLRLAHGATIIPHRRAGGVTPDLMVVPGGGWKSNAAFGARAEVGKPNTLGFIRGAHGSGAVIAGVCTGAMLLAHAGLLNGRPAITHHSAIDDLRAAGADVKFERVVDDENIVTCGGVTAGIDLALWLVERFFGKDKANETAVYLEYERRGYVWIRPK